MLLLLRCHRAKRVVSSGKLTSEISEGLLGIHLDLVALLTSNAGSKRELSQVSSNTNTSALYHLRVFGGEGRALELLIVHIADVESFLVVSVVGLDHRIEQISELRVTSVTASIAPNARVSVLATRQDALFEGDPLLILSIL